MSSANPRRSHWLILGRVLILALIAAAFIRSKLLPSFLDPYGLLFVLAGGAALGMISYSGAEILRALRHASGMNGPDAEIRNSIHFWEAAGRSFWMLGVLHSVLSLIIAFAAMAFMEVNQTWIVNTVARLMLTTFYGLLLAVICIVPCWKLKGELRSRQPAPNSDQGAISVPTVLPGWRFGAVFGYVLFLSVIVVTVLKFPTPNLWGMLSFMVHWPALLIVLGGAVAIMLFVGGGNSELTLSTAFACMGFIGALIGCIQAMFGFGMGSFGGPKSIYNLALGVAFVLESCFAGLLGMLLVGAPLEDRAIRTGRIAEPAAVSRVSWYVFPLLAMIFLILAFLMLTAPLPKR